MNPELLGSFLSARPTGRQFGPARIAAVPIWFHWGVVASDPASAFEDVLSLDTILARKNKSMEIPEKLLQYQDYQVLVVDKLEGLDVSSFPRSWIFFWVSWQVWLGHLQARYEGWILAHPTRSQSLGKKNILPKTGLWNPWRCFFWAQQGRLQAFNHPQKRLPKNQFGSNATGTLQEDCGSSQGHGWGFTITCPFFWKNTDIISPKNCLRDLFRIYPIFRQVYSNML